ncbi:MAG: hypothetical protein CSA66_05740 [Proteobacteria bacterium]|nr:MAG: hypothetical protein CSA66_05740 [Pseudomonadota bacterium]
MRLENYFTMAMGALVLAAGAMACDSSGGGGTSALTDTMGGTDTTEAGDAVDAEAGDAVDADDTTPTTADTSSTTDDVTPSEDTTNETDTNQTVERLCSDAELGEFQSCVQGCGQQDVECLQACFTTKLSAACQGAYRALGDCARQHSCGDTDTACIVENCPNETLAVFGSSPEPNDCDPVADTGCDDDHTCTLVSPTEVGCAPKGGAGYGEDCSSVRCAQGACLSFDGTSSECMEFCDQQNNTCREDRPCNIGIQGGDFTFCGDIPVACDIFAQNCDDGQGCYVIDTDGNTGCHSAGGQQAGASCQAVNDCAPGHLCAGNPGTCSLVCEIDGDPTGCPDGEECAAVRGLSIGVCVSPQ